MTEQGDPPPLDVSPVRTRRELKAFIRLPWALYRDDPNWIAPLIVERRELLNPAKNPYFDHAEVRLWLARRGRRVVGRISAQINRAHLERHADATGHFGMLEAEDDGQVFAALFDAARDWLRSRGMQRLVGPFNLSINDESGLLIDGFDTPPMIMMGHGAAFYPPRVEEQGLTKVKDLICYNYGIATKVPPAVRAFAAKSLRDLPLKVRHMDLSAFFEELTVIVDIFNDAWAENWGFVPMSDAEIRHMAKSLKPIVRRETAVIAELDGEPVAMAISLPNVNEAIADLNGRLLPLGWLKLLWRLKVKTPKSTRLPLMGIRRKYHGTPLGAGLAYAVIEAVRDGQERLGVERAELSWILEDNLAMRGMIEQIGGVAYKTYRLYEQAL